MSVKKLTAVLLLLSSVMTFAEDSASSMPRVLILTTGGTIASRTDAPLIDGPALVQAVPEQDALDVQQPQRQSQSCDHPSRSSSRRLRRASARPRASKIARARSRTSGSNRARESSRVISA